MNNVSQDWIEKFQDTILPETFVEISCNYGDSTAEKSAEVSGLNEAYFGTSEYLMVDKRGMHSHGATLEPNFWTFGTFALFPDTYSGDENARGVYVSEEDTGGIVIRFPEVVTTTIPGITITWGKEYDEYATQFTVTVKNGATEVANIVVNDNRSVISQVDADLTGYDSIKISVTGWSIPNHRVRIQQVQLGHIVVFGKSDILSFSHEESGDINSGELPRRRIEFGINNVNKRWNPYNPSGDTKYLAEKQKVVVRYGMDINGSVEWITGGTFYLSEWKIPANGIEARFVATDAFEQLSNTETTSYTIGEYGVSDFISLWLDELKHTEGVDIPDDFLILYNGDPNVTVNIPYREQGYSAGEVLQLIANSACCVIDVDSSNVFHIEPLETPSIVEYFVTLDLAYSYPELELTKPLKKVSVRIDDENTFVLDVASTGEVLTVDNPLIVSEEDASRVANWIAGNVSGRKIIRGEYRADPRLHLFDVIWVWLSENDLRQVLVTNIKYSYTGSFYGTYEGYLL